MLPRHLAGAAVGESLLDRARGVLSRIKKALGPVLGPVSDPRAAKEEGTLRKAARVLAEGASAAAKFAGQVKDDVAKDLRKLASDAWSLAFPPVLIVGALYLLSQQSDNRSGRIEPLTVAGLLYLAARVL